MYIPWTMKRQALYFSFVLLIIFGLGVFVWLNISAPTCSDNKQNQGEDGIDCGEPCGKECLREIKEPIVLWSQALKVGEGVYDAAAVAVNQNLFLSAPSAKYQFKLYDKNNVLIATKEGETLITSGRKFAIFESGIDTGRRAPHRTFLELEKNIKWQRHKGEATGLIVVKKEYIDFPYPTLSVVVSNESINVAENIHAVAVIYDKDGNARAASAAKIESIKADSSQEIFFTWPTPLGDQAFSNEIFLNVELPLFAPGS